MFSQSSMPVCFLGYYVFNVVRSPLRVLGMILADLDSSCSINNIAYLSTETQLIYPAKLALVSYMKDILRYICTVRARVIGRLCYQLGTTRIE